jgi:hypothetical protein
MFQIILLLTKCFTLCIQVEDYSLVKFMPLDRTDEDSINDLLLHIDNAIQYGEDLDIKVKVRAFLNQATQ